MKYLMPLLALGAIRHSHCKSKSLNSSVVMMSPPRIPAIFLRIPSSITHPLSGKLFFLKLRHPFVVLPSKSKRQPAAFSAAVTSFSFASASAAREAGYKEGGVNLGVG